MYSSASLTADILKVKMKKHVKFRCNSVENNRTINEIILHHGETDCFNIVLTLCNKMISLKIMLHNFFFPTWLTSLLCCGSFHMRSFTSFNILGPLYTHKQSDLRAACLQACKISFRWVVNIDQSPTQLTPQVLLSHLNILQFHTWLHLLQKKKSNAWNLILFTYF